MRRYPFKFKIRLTYKALYQKNQDACNVYHEHALWAARCWNSGIAGSAWVGPTNPQEPNDLIYNGWHLNLSSQLKSKSLSAIFYGFVWNEPWPCHILRVCKLYSYCSFYKFLPSYRHLALESSFLHPFVLLPRIQLQSHSRCTVAQPGQMALLENFIIVRPIIIFIIVLTDDYTKPHSK